VSNAGLLHLTLPANAPLGSNFTFSVMFSNLAMLSVSAVNMSVIVYPSLQVCCSLHLMRLHFRVDD
jgi:hypothetical protein